MVYFEFMWEPTSVSDGRGTRTENHRPQGGLLQRQNIHMVDNNMGHSNFIGPDQSLVLLTFGWFKCHRMRSRRRSE